MYLERLAQLPILAVCGFAAAFQPSCYHAKYHFLSASRVTSPTAATLTEHSNGVCAYAEAVVVVRALVDILERRGVKSATASIHARCGLGQYV